MCENNKKPNKMKEKPNKMTEKPNKMTEKSNKFDRKQRLDKILQLLAEGKLRYEIMAICTAEWGLKESGVQAYIDDAYLILKNAFTDEDLAAMYKDIHKRTIEEQPSIALKALDSIAKLKKGGYSNNVTVGEINIKFDE